MADKKHNLGRTLKQRRTMIPLTLSKLSATTGVSLSHLARIESGERFPSARVLQKIAKPLGLGDSELLTLAGYLSPQTSAEVKKLGVGQLDPWVAAMLSQEPVRIQRAILMILSVLKSMAKMD